MLQQHDTAFLLNNFGKMQNWDKKKKKKIHQAKIHISISYSLCHN